MLARSGKVLLLVASGFLYVGCASNKAQEPRTNALGGAIQTGEPPWVNGRSPKYPDIYNIVAVGHGVNREMCEHDAYGALARVFEARVQSVANDWQQHFSTVNNTGTVKVESMKVDQLTRVSTEKVVKGARIAETYQSPSQIHCLAVLERDASAANLKQEIGTLDAEIQALIKRGDEIQGNSAKYLAYGQAMDRFQQREALNEDLRIVDSEGRGVPAMTGWSDLVSKFTTSRENAKVGLLLTGDQAVTVQTCIAEQLTKNNIQVMEGSSDVELMVHGNLDYQKAGNVGGSELVKATINMRIENLSDGKTVAAFNDSVKVGRRDLQQSIQLAVSKLCAQTAPQLAEKIHAALRR